MTRNEAIPRYILLPSCLDSTSSDDFGFSPRAMMMLMHAAVRVWVDRGQGGGCACHLACRAQKSFDLVGVLTPKSFRWYDMGGSWDQKREKAVATSKDTSS